MTGVGPPSPTEMRTGARRSLELHLVTVLWGDWYCRMFTEALLPTLLSPGNLPALIGKARIKYTIQTTRHDSILIRNSRTFKHLAELTDLSIVVRDDFDPLKIMTTHHRIWNEAREEAIERKAWLFLLPPDLVCSDGSFAKLVKLMAEGKDAVYCNTIRVASETFVNDLHQIFGTNSSVAVSAPARELLKLAVQHYHPLNIAQSYYSKDFSIFEELIHFPVGRGGRLEGFVLCSPISCPFFVVRPAGRYRVSTNHVVVEGRDFDGLSFVSDSDDMLFLSLIPLLQYRDSYVDHGPMNPAVVSKTTLAFDNILARRQAALKFRFHIGSGKDHAWRMAEQRATLTMSRINTAREYLRVWKALRQTAFARAAEVIASAIFSDVDYPLCVRHGQQRCSCRLRTLWTSAISSTCYARATRQS